MSRVQDQEHELNILQQQLASVYTERNICVGIIAQMALDKGWNVGYLPKENPAQTFQLLLVDFPDDQICWEINDTDWETIPLFHKLPEYTGLVEAPCAQLDSVHDIPALV